MAIVFEGLLMCLAPEVYALLTAVDCRWLVTCEVVFEESAGLAVLC